MDLSPIVLFVFSRPQHTSLTLKALANNVLADQSDLIIYSDAGRNSEESALVGKVRSLLRTIEGFRSVSIVERKTNYGLARNITEGVTEVCSRYGRVIVLEDDIVTSPQFLPFMNKALEHYADEPRVWHVSGWNYPINPVGIGDTFFWQTMNCWGWATWADRWQYYEKDPESLLSLWDRGKIRRFNLGGSYNFWSQVELNFLRRIDTWAIFWYATIFERDGLCLNPAESLVHNIGHDGSGENCGDSDLFSHVISSDEIYEFPERVEESSLALQRITQFYSRCQKFHIYNIFHHMRIRVAMLLGRIYAK